MKSRCSTSQTPVSFIPAYSKPVIIICNRTPLSDLAPGDSFATFGPSREAGFKGLAIGVANYLYGIFARRRGQCDCPARFDPVPGHVEIVQTR